MQPAYKTFTIQDFERDFEATLKGEFKKVYYHNGTIISSDEANGFLSGEAVVCVKRCCSSLTSYFPSGVFSIVTWTFTAQTVRHEYLIIYTTNYVILIELSSGGEKNCKQSCITKIAISDSKEKDRKRTEKELTADKWYKRDLATLKGEELGILKMDQILRAIDAWILIARGENQKYSLLQRNCKSLARTIRYFAERNVDYRDVMYSALGIFTDKPGKVLIHLDTVLAEKAFLQAAKLCSKRTHQNVEDVMKLFEGIRTRNLKKVMNEP